MSKKNLFLGGILVILVVIAYIYQGPLKEWRESISKPKNFLANVNIDEIDKLEIIKSEVVTILERDSDRWKIEGTKDFYVEDSLANTLVKAISDATKGDLELVSKNKDKKIDYKTEGSGVEVKLYNGEKQVSDFIVGLMSLDNERVYISQSGLDKTYSTTVNLFNPLYRNEWRDNTIFDTDKEKITKIRFQYPNREFTIEKREVLEDSPKEGEQEVQVEWGGVLPYKFAVSKEKADEIVGIMANLKAANIPEQDFSATGLEKNSIIIEASGEEINNILMIGGASADNGDLYYAKKGNSDNIYLINKEQKDGLDKRIIDLK
ncbi:MAG: DUF4340 domain-containing protein [Patescibacteria group bacterium]